MMFAAPAIGRPACAPAPPAQSTAGPTSSPSKTCAWKTGALIRRVYSSLFRSTFQIA